MRTVQETRLPNLYIQLITDPYNRSYVSPQYIIKFFTSIVWTVIDKYKDIHDISLSVDQSRYARFLNLLLERTPSKECTPEISTKQPYQFMKIIYEINPTNKITINHLFENSGKYSLINLFDSYLDILKVKGDIKRLIIFTNTDIDIDAFKLKFLLPAKEDSIFYFGKQYCIDADIFQYLLIMRDLQEVIKRHEAEKIKIKTGKTENGIVFDFLKKLILAVDQPSVDELKKLIIEDIRMSYTFPEVLYNALYNEMSSMLFTCERISQSCIPRDTIQNHVVDTYHIVRY